MFETVELGRKLSKKDYEKHELVLRADLLEAQRAARAAGIPVLVLVSGVEGAGKGQVVNRLTTWADPRGMQVHAIWDETEEERDHPRWWRFWRRMPPRGTIGVLFGSWYTDPIVDRAFDRIDDEQLARELQRIEAHERMLALDGALIVKLWFHISHDTQVRRYEEDERTTPGRWKLSPVNEAYLQRYDRFVQASERAIRATDTGYAPWHLIEAEDARYRDLTAGYTVLHAIRRALDGPPAPPPRAAPLPTSDLPGTRRTVLDRVDLGQALDKKAYEGELEELQLRLHRLAWGAYAQRRSLVAAFEGWDAAGKGGAIRRAVDAVDARLVSVVPIAAPTEEERARHYLWRFWRHVPRAGRMTVFDRSWYGRVLVERVEGFATHDAWSRAYHEINEFEAQLAERGIALCKFWLHIDRDEQKRRFEARTTVPYKQYKITDEDWRNRERWPDYERAVHEMVERTSTRVAPWTLVAANDKRTARITVLRTMCEAFEAAGVSPVA